MARWVCKCTCTGVHVHVCIQWHMHGCACVTCDMCTGVLARACARVCMRMRYTIVSSIYR